MAQKNFPIDFVRQIIIRTLLEQHEAHPSKYFGGGNQVSLFSFYEQLQKEEEVNRFTEIYQDLVNQQNRSGLIMNGVIISPDNPTITNLNQCSIIPLTFTCSFRVSIGDRDKALETINNLIEILKGRKRDVAEFDNGVLFMVGTIANNIDGTPTTKDGDFIGQVDNETGLGIQITNIKDLLVTKGITFNDNAYYYVENTDTHKLVAVKKVNGVWTAITDQKSYPDVLVPPPHNSFEKYKISLSFESIRCDEPRNLNAKEYCVISFGGSATVVSNGVALGNDLTKLGIKRKLIKAETDITISDNYHWLEPLELPSGNNADTQINQLVSNKFLTNTHTDSVSLTLQYTFIVDKTIPLLKQLFMYGRYGTTANGSTIPYNQGISPNMIFEIMELWSSWGEVEPITFKAKIVESIDIENTESDTLTITIPLQIQGDNN